MSQLKEWWVTYWSTDGPYYMVVSILFFFTWIKLFMSGLYFLPFWLFLLVPIFLVVGAVQYTSRVAYGITLAIFIAAILIELRSLPHYIEQYQLENNGGISHCSCCPECEIQSILISVMIAAVAIAVMNGSVMRASFGWKKSYSWGIGVLVALLMKVSLYLVEVVEW